MRVLFFARDPGGANTIIPIINKMQEEYEILCYGKDVALQRIRQSGLACRDIMEEVINITEDSIYHFLYDLKVQTIITGTSLDDFTERYLWKAAKRVGIFSIAIQDQWINLGIRFSKFNYAKIELYNEQRSFEYLPDKICIMDELGKKLLIEEGMDEHRICVTGQPHFETLQRKYNDINIQKDRERFTVIYVSEPILQDYDSGDEEKLYWGFNEHTMYNKLIECLHQISDDIKKKIDVIIRPHPREKLTYWEQVKKDYIDINVSIDNKTDTFELLKKADVVCGMSSMFLLEANICKVPIISMMIGLKRENPFVLDKIGLCKSVTSKEELYEKMQAVIFEKDDIVAFEIIDNATENVINLLEEYRQ